MKTKTDYVTPAKAGGPEQKSWIPAGVYPAHDAGRE